MTEDQTDHIHKQKPSSILNVSIRGWISLLIIGTFCFTYVWLVVAGKPMTPEMATNLAGIKEIALVVVAFYFGVTQQERFGKNKTTPP